jgi:hypothetical protein
MPEKLNPQGRAAPAPKKTPRATKKKSSSKKKQQPKKTASPASKIRYARNLHGAAGGIRVLLMNDTEIKLAPRGQVGDLMPVSEEDRYDPHYVANYGVLFEEISSAEAKAVVSKQNTNAQAPRQSTMDQLTNQKGEKYEQAAPTVEQSYEDQGMTVAEIQKAGDGRFTEQNTQLVRSPGAAPEQQNVPGSPGNPVPNIPADVPPEQVADWLARNQGKDEAQAADTLRAQLGGGAKIEPPQTYNG